MQGQLSGTEYCATCGVVEPKLGTGHCMCEAMLAGPEALNERIQAARGGDRSLYRSVGWISDPSCREALEVIVDDGARGVGDDGLITAAAEALANIASPASMPVMRALVPNAWGNRIMRIIRYFGRIGTPEAIDALVEMLPTWNLPAARALAALGDERGLRALPVTDPCHPDYTRNARAMDAERWGPMPPELPADPSSTTTAVAWALDYELGDAEHAGTRFGGQPTWLAEPTWPLTTAGTPMAFWAQVRLPGDEDRMAYLFVQRQFDPISSEDGTASVFIQPGGEPIVPWIRSATGPVVPDTTVRDRSYRPPHAWGMAPRVPSLRPFGEPLSWDDTARIRDQSWDKVGGTPVFLQYDPGLDDYEFLYQFTAAAAGQELGDAAQCYVFVNRDRGDGYFYWDCH